MKKILNLLAIALIAIVSFNVQSVNAQEPIWSEDFSGVATPTGNLTQCETSNSAFNESTFNAALTQWDYSGSFKVYPSTGKVKIGTSSDAGYIQTLPIDLSEYGSIRVVFEAKAWNGSNTHTTMTVSVNGTEFPIEGLPKVNASTDTIEGACDMGTFEIVADAGGLTVLRFTGDTRAFIDNIAIYPAEGAAMSIQGNNAFPLVGANEPSYDTLIAKGFDLDPNGTTTVTIDDSHFTTTVTTIANSALMTEAGALIPVVFSADSAGTYTANLTLTNDSVTSTKTLTASVYTSIATIAELRTRIDYSDVNANVTGDLFYKYTGEATVTQESTGDGYNKWMQDETGAIQLYDPEGLISNAHTGMGVSNMLGHMANYYGYCEFSVKSSCSIDIMPEYIPQPIVVTLAELQDVDYMNSIQAELIELEDVTFNEGASDRFERTRYAITQGENTDSAVYISSQYDPMYGQFVPRLSGNIIGVNLLTNAYAASTGSGRVGYARYYILPREFEGFNVSISENEMNSLNVFPNPTSSDVVLSINAPATHVAIYNMVGELVDSQSINAGSNTVKMSNLTNGVYFLRVFNGNELVGTSKVVRN